MSCAARKTTRKNQKNTKRERTHTKTMVGQFERIERETIKQFPQGQKLNICTYTKVNIYIFTKGLYYLYIYIEFVQVMV